MIVCRVGGVYYCCAASRAGLLFYIIALAAEGQAAVEYAAAV